MTSEFIFIRHGETDWNRQQRFQGQSDIPLNSRGQLQARALGDRLKNLPITAIYSSDLTRCMETTRPIADHHTLTPILEPRLKEIHFGDWEGKTYLEIEQTHPESLEQWQTSYREFAPPRGETFPEMEARVRDAFQDIQSSHPEGLICLVAHGGPLQVLLSKLLGLPAEQFWQFHLSTGSISRISIFPEGAILNLLNDTCHLARE